MTAVTTTEAAQMLGLASTHAARTQLRRWGVKPVARNPGKGGESLYDADQVRQALESRPGRGARTDLKRSQT